MLGLTADEQLDNAVKFTPRGGRIDLRITTLDATAVLEVRDSGHGLPKELGERVFDVFVQGEQTLDRPSGGLGIGLSLVKRLARAAWRQRASPQRPRERGDIHSAVSSGPATAGECGRHPAARGVTHRRAPD